MRIIDHSTDQITSYIIHEGKLRTTVSHSSLASYFREMYHSRGLATWEQITCLLDERLFSYYRFSIDLTTKTPYTIHALKKLIQDKLTEIKYTGSSSEYIIHRLADMYVDGEEVPHILGKTGSLSFVIEVCVLQPEGIAVCELLWGSRVLDHPHISLYPRHYYTLTYLREHHQSRYALLFIEQQTSQLLLVQDGRYEELSYINIWLNLLKECYQQHDVEKYFYTSRAEVVTNPFLNKVIDEAVSFFTDMLAKWMQQYIGAHQSIMVAGDIIANPSFLPLFQDSYSAFGSSYILPLAPVQSRKVDHTFLPKEIAVASYLRYLERD